MQGFFDLCTGCRICELICSSTKFDVYAPRNAAIEVRTVHEGLASSPTLCFQCEEPYCLKSCPFGAIEKNEEMGIVQVVFDKCTGCGMCTKACPVEGAIKIAQLSRKAVKCDICGGDPECVKYCLTGALKLIKIRSEER